jgi:hypothetical protein
MDTSSNEKPSLRIFKDGWPTWTLTVETHGAELVAPKKGRYFLGPNEHRIYLAESPPEESKRPAAEQPRRRRLRRAFGLTR